MSLEQVLVRMIATFKKYSGADGKSGELDQSELARLVKEDFPNLTSSGKDEQVLASVMKMLDLDGDRKVSYKDYATIMAFLSMELDECL